MSESTFAEDFARGRWDVDFFAWRFLGIKFHPGQLGMAQAYLRRTKSGWRAAYLWLMVAAGNRAGKTLALAIIIFHSCIYKMGLEPPGDFASEAAVNRWRQLPYHWWHFAIEQGPAEQVYSEIALILQGVHPAQRAGCPLVEELGGPAAVAIFDSKERGEYAWIRFSPMFGGAEVHFRSTKQKALGSLGQNMHGVSFDEAGLEPNLGFLLKEVLHFRRLGTGGQFILISTPSAATSPDFEDLWFTGDPESPFRSRRRFSMRMSTRLNVGYGLDRETFEAMLEGVDEQTIRQNIDGEFIQSSAAYFNAPSVDAAFVDGVPEHTKPCVGHFYVHGVDPGLTDKTWSLILDVMANGSAYGVNVERAEGRQTTRGIVEMAARNHHLYAEKAAWIETGVDATALGGKMFRELLEEKVPGVRSVEFGGQTQVKRKLLGDLKTMIDEGRLRLPAAGTWGEVRRQLRGYKLNDRKIEQDAVMALAVAVKLLRQTPAGGAVSAPFDLRAADVPEQSVGENWVRAPFRHPPRL